MQFFKEIEQLAKEHHREDPRGSMEAFERFLAFWWCQKFGGCIKDPILTQYKPEELLYEFLRHHYMKEDPIAAEQAAKRIAEDTAWATKKAQELAESTRKLKQAADRTQQTNKSQEMPLEASTKAPGPQQNPHDTIGLPDAPDISIKFNRPPK